MKKAIFILISFCLVLNASDFVSPINFEGTKSEKEAVIAFIKSNVKKTYSEIGIGDPSTLRLMEKKELESFKKLTKAKNKKLLKNVITTYCNIGMCNYNTIQLMYKKQLEDSKKELEW